MSSVCNATAGVIMRHAQCIVSSAKSYQNFSMMMNKIVGAELCNATAGVIVRRARCLRSGVKSYQDFSTMMNKIVGAGLNQI